MLGGFLFACLPASSCSTVLVLLDMMLLQDILFSQGFGTRRVSCGLVQQGLVQLGESRQPCDDPVAEVDETGLVFWVQGVRWEYHERAYLMLHKPAGFECSQKPGAHPSVYTLLPRCVSAAAPPQLEFRRWDGWTTTPLVCCCCRTMASSSTG